MEGVLKGVRVLDFGRYIAGPFCAALLADFGADVIRVEKRRGSEDRWLVPVVPESEGGEGGMFLQCNRNKRGMTLSPLKPEGREIVRRLVETSDVFIANLPGETLEAMGLDYETLAAINPRIVHTTMSAYGEGGPYSDRVGFDAVAQALCGSVHLTGWPDQPVRSMVSWADYGTAALSAFATLAALVAREQTGRGQKIEGSLLSTALNFFNAQLIEQDCLKLNREAALNRSQTAGPSDLFRCKDGWITVLVNGDQIFQRWVELMDEPHWLTDPRFASDELRGKNGALLSERTSQWAADKTVEEAIQLLAEARLPSGPIYTPQQALDDPHIQAMNYLTRLGYPGLERGAPVASPPIRMSETPATIGCSAPRLGEHTTEILAEIGYSEQDIARFVECGAI